MLDAHVRGMAARVQRRPGQPGARSAPVRRRFGEGIASAKPGPAPYVHDVAAARPGPQIRVGIQGGVVVHPPGRRVRTGERVRREEKERPGDGELADHSLLGRRRLLAENLGEGFLQIPVQVGAGEGGSRRLRGVCAGPPSATGQGGGAQDEEQNEVYRHPHDRGRRQKKPPPRPAMPSGRLPVRPVEHSSRLTGICDASVTSPLGDTVNLKNRSN